MMDKEFMLYFHVPFCAQKCHYCDFLSFPQTEEVRERYVSALLQELRERRGERKGRIVTSMFIGGGTPSLLSPAQIADILREAYAGFDVSPDAEITMECNPGTATESTLAGYREAGVNRLSLGLQSAKNEELRLLGRIHDYATFLETYHQARQAGFSNVNVDLMNALPGQTERSWKETLETVLSLKPAPEHLSVYSLILEEHTPFFEWNRQGKFTGALRIPSEELDRQMYAYTGQRLRRAGFGQYEISNYARPGYECRHNYGYWTRREYLGLGLGAASLIAEKRYSNETDLDRYLQNPLAGRQEQVLSRREQMEEFVFLGLRTCKGVSGEEFQKTFGRRLEELYGQVMKKNVSDGLLISDETGIRLTARGMDLSNYVSAQFLLEE